MGGLSLLLTLAEDAGAQPMVLTSTVVEAGESPLDAQTLALIDALTSTGSAEGQPQSAAPELVWPPGAPLSREISDARARETLGNSFSSVFEALPTLQGSLRGRLGAIRKLDNLRVEPTEIDLGRLDPWLYHSSLVRRGPSAMQASRLWTSDVALRGQAPPSEQRGWLGEASVVGRSADRGLGVFGGLSGSSEAASFRVSARVDVVDDLRVRTGTASIERSSAARRVGLSTRVRLFGRSKDILQIDIGYDFDAREPMDDGLHLPDLHLLQTRLALRVGQIALDFSGGWVGRHGPDDALNFLQAQASARWAETQSAEVNVEALFDDPNRFGGRLAFRPARRREAEVGARFSTSLERPVIERRSVYVRGAFDWESLSTEVSLRLSDQRSPDSNPGPGVSVDVRADVELMGPFHLWARYARSYAFLEVGGVVPETGDLAEAGPRLVGQEGWLEMSVWWAQIDDVARLGSSPARLEAWGLTAEGAIQWDRLVVAGAVSRAEPESGVVARLSSRMRFSEWDGFVELGLRTLVDPDEPSRLRLLPERAEPSSYAVFDVRGAVSLGLGFRLFLAVDNVLDSAWSAYGSEGPEPGVDLRLSLGWTSF